MFPNAVYVFRLTSQGPIQVMPTPAKGKPDTKDSTMRSTKQLAKHDMVNVIDVGTEEYNRNLDETQLIRKLCLAQ